MVCGLQFAGAWTRLTWLNFPLAASGQLMESKLNSSTHYSLLILNQHRLLIEELLDTQQAKLEASGLGQGLGPRPRHASLANLQMTHRTDNNTEYTTLLLNDRIEKALSPEQLPPATG